MKIIKLLILFCVSALTSASAAETFRTDINPALLHWQAFAVLPDLAPEDQKYLFETEWRTRPMDERAGTLLSRFDNVFRLLRRAAASKVPCDWGVDLSDGPGTLLPHLAKAKHCALAARLRARWFVQQNRQEAARDDLAAAFVLGRNLSRDQVLISALVQIAIEEIVCMHVVQQWPQLETPTIAALLDAFDQAPPRGTIAACMRTEKTAFYGWLVRQLEELQAKYPGDEPKALAAAAQLMTDAVSEENQTRTGFGARVIAAAGSSMTGLIAYARESEPFYSELENVMNLPYAEFGPANESLQNRAQAIPNLLLAEFFPAFTKVRLKEFRVTSHLAMLHAAYHHRLDPSQGLQKVKDPFGKGPFEYSRFVLDGIDRGFKLKSQLKTPDFDDVLIFAEKPGPAFYTDGPPAGQKIQ